MGGLTALCRKGRLGGRELSSTTIHWLVGDGLPEHSAILEAVPGVGNVGKVLVDSLISKHPSRTLGWILNHDLPPHSTLDENGLLRPPRLEISSVMLPDGKTIVTISGELQPMTPGGQHEVAEAILTIAKESSTPNVLVLAGLATEAESRGIHVICADEKVRSSLEADDILVSREQPESGMIGIAGLLVSLSPIIGVRSIGLVADTVGASADVLAANRLASWIEEGFDLKLDLDLDSTEETARKLLETYEVGGTLEEAMGVEESDSHRDFYA